MKIGILADTHDELVRTRAAVCLLQERGVEAIIHCGDLTGPEILATCAVLPLYFTFGNHDADTVPYLKAAAEEHGAVCLGWGGELTLAGKRLAVVHGHLTFDLRPLLLAEPDYLFSGHSHIAGEWIQGGTRRINPGALHRTERFSVAVLDLYSGELGYLFVE